MKKWLYERGCFFNDGEKILSEKKRKTKKIFINKYLQSRKMFGNASIL